MTKNYNETLNLPKTEFPMRGNLPEKEPETLKMWENKKIYKKMIEKNKNNSKYVLHMGPPYANGSIHLGHALTTTLKDFIVKYKNMAGFNSPLIPGWDCHGLPTELKARAKVGEEKAKKLTDLELRNLCKEVALSYVDMQREGFKRLGCTGDWENPYMTLQPEYEQKQIEVFAKMAGNGAIYKGLKPVHWCPKCETALAEAELEYKNSKCNSIYVKFRVKDDKNKFTKFGANLNKTYFIIWTTTTWTLPGNVAICAGPDITYDLIKCGNEYFVIAELLKEKVLITGNFEKFETIAQFKGTDLEFMTAEHPFLERESLLIVGDHVTVASGTGLVHTAPGHGLEDFEVCQNYKDLKIVVPVDSQGVLTKEAGPFAELDINTAGKVISEYLKENNLLFAYELIDHSYPHCWRCKTEVIFRATKQWFCSIEKIKQKAIEAIKSVKWIPKWGEFRMESMISERSDWCISRQRKWGVPIPIFYCKKCYTPLIDETSMMKVAEIFGKEGSDSWFANESEHFLPGGTVCKECSHEKFIKEKDIMDVWFDSGSSHEAVCQARSEIGTMADVYLEGGDQHRGWFQSSLLTSIAIGKGAPYKTVISHGMIIDEDGKKQSKSAGNGVSPELVINQYGADVLRLWVSSADYQSDVKVSNEILKQISESYRKIRNTARFILGNLYDFDPNKDLVSNSELKPIDTWALSVLNDVIDKCTKSYDNFEFHMVYHMIQNFCIVDMSNFYLDILKDRLYVTIANSTERRSAQSAIYHILTSLTKLIAPILSFTAEEIWKFTPKLKEENFESIFLCNMPEKLSIKNIDVEYWNKIQKIRDSVKKVLEVKRKEKIIGSSSEAEVFLYTSGEFYEFIKNAKNDIKTALIVSSIHISKDGTGENSAENFDNLSISVKHSEYRKCERCWAFKENVGKSSICKECEEVLAQNN